MTKTEQAKRDIHKIVQVNDLSRQLKKARQECGVDSHSFYALLKEMLINLDEGPDRGMDEARRVFDELIDPFELDELDIT